MNETIESRLEKLEREVARLKAKVDHDKSNWVHEIAGTFDNDSDFDEIVRIGKELRDAEKPEDN